MLFLKEHTITSKTPAKNWKIFKVKFSVLERDINSPETTALAVFKLIAKKAQHI